MGVKTAVRQAVGAAAVKVFSNTAQTIRSGERAPSGFVEKLISENLIKAASAAGDYEALRGQLAGFWQGESGDTFYDTFRHRFESSFLGPHYPLVQALAAMVSDSSADYQRVVEIGCGDGRVLEHLAEKLKENIPNYVGLDINEQIIAENRKRYSDERLSFEACDVGDWFGKNAAEGTVLMSYGGVMEYLLDTELTTLFNQLRESGPAIVALVEPLYGDYDPSVETVSRSMGMECSFSHNHRHLLEEAGFTVSFYELISEEFSWVMLVASTEA